jgi:fibro-slime domain-containing protein
MEMHSPLFSRAFRGRHEAASRLAFWMSVGVVCSVLPIAASCSNIKRAPAAATGGHTGSDDLDASVGPSWDGGFDLLRPPSGDAGCTSVDGGALTSGCLVANLCGNGTLNGPGETCDDGNVVGGDGCSATCQVESDWICATPGQPCVSAVVCGDGRIAGAETCDDRNTVAGDGCSPTCTIETGWQCPVAGARCLPVCGDGLRLGAETCDDGNTTAGDGCSSSCRVETGYACPTAAQPCHPTVCGDGVKEGDESCDDGNLVGGDGCSSTCQAEPVCVGTNGCTSPCGDGLKLPGEACDDGNTTSGDGCSADCMLEPGWSCADVGTAEGNQLTVDVVYRDFIRSGVTGGHPNFEAGIGGACPGMVQPILGADRTPLMVDPPPGCSELTTAADFAEWYHDSPLGKTIPDKLTLARQPDGTYLFDHSEIWSGSATTGWTLPPYFPLDGRGWATPPAGPELPYLSSCDQDQVPHNFSFTSAVRYWFSYAGGETLSFIGDDDVWVFVNGHLAVDIGGVHSPVAGAVTLDAAAATRLGLTVGQVYEIAVFQAERHTCGSSYKLTLGNFGANRTVCTPRCGDGVVNGTELCDDGVNDGSYGGCLPGCGGLGPYCGDGKVAPGVEQCDDGVNRATYGQPGCGPGCRTAPRCGDGHVDGMWGEACDDGNQSNTDGCTSTCQISIQ